GSGGGLGDAGEVLVDDLSFDPVSVHGQNVHGVEVGAGFAVPPRDNPVGVECDVEHVSPLGEVVEIRGDEVNNLTPLQACIRFVLHYGENFYGLVLTSDKSVERAVD